MRLFVGPGLFVKGANILKWKVWISGKQSTERSGGPTQRDVQLVEAGPRPRPRQASGPGLWKDPGVSPR